MRVSHSYQNRNSATVVQEMLRGHRARLNIFGALIRSLRKRPRCRLTIEIGKSRGCDEWRLIRKIHSLR